MTQRKRGLYGTNQMRIKILIWLRFFRIRIQLILRWLMTLQRKERNGKWKPKKKINKLIRVSNNHFGVYPLNNLIKKSFQLKFTRVRKLSKQIMIQVKREVFGINQNKLKKIVIIQIRTCLVTLGGVTYRLLLLPLLKNKNSKLMTL